jgi:SHS2 domain-containing protein
MENEGKFEFLEHTADILIAAHGKNLEEAFENAALAMFEVMTDTTKINPVQEDTVEVSAEDEYALLYNWLEALLVKFEVNDMLFSKFKIASLQDTGEEFKLKATIWGEKYNPDKHPQKVAVKAVTYHRMEFIKELESLTVEFILDI